ncbi:MAG: hypothetical protein GX415_05045 [Chloroflexi bacterium]|nr:hypothetical protein [Anaerolineaceae bacterium]NLI44761.1 hypothetical protein [Chloroflexota bacterium]HQL27249.1 hypothetical protein [Anaerolineaceae bacterium]
MNQQDNQCTKKAAVFFTAIRCCPCRSAGTCYTVGNPAARTFWLSTARAIAR